MQSVFKNPLIAIFQSSAASLNLGLSQNGVLGSGLTVYFLKIFESYNPLPNNEILDQTQFENKGLPFASS